MKAIFLLLTAIVLSHAKLADNYVDLGEMGITHEIAEKDMLSAFDKSVEEINATKLKAQALADYERQKTANADIPSCMENKIYYRPHEVEIKRDTYDVEGKILYRKGEHVKVKPGIKRVLCILDGSTPERLQRSITSVTEGGTCSKTLVSGLNIDKVDDNKKLGQIYPYHKVLADALGAQCFPSRITAENGILFFEEYDVKKETE